MKTSINKQELKQLNACEDGYKTFINAHGDNEAAFSQCLDSNGWDDIWWLISEVYDQLSEEQKHDLRLYGCSKALIHIEKIKPYCSSDDYKVITDYLNNPTDIDRESAWSAAESAASSAASSAARSAAWSASSAARSAASSAARSAASSAARSEAWSAASSAARSAAESAVIKENIKTLRELFVKWESNNED